MKNNGIKPFSLKKDYDQINQIKKIITKEYRDDLEWLEIKKIGMVYRIDLVKRINNKPLKKEEYCNIYANKEGLVKRIIYDNGVALVNLDELVKKDDLLITGAIKKDEEIKDYVCASGKVYAEVWYQIEIRMPLYEERIINKNINIILLYYEVRNTRININISYANCSRIYGILFA